MDNWIDFVCVHSVGRICVQCCNVFSKVCVCTVNVVLSLSTLLSSVAVSHSEGSVCGQIGAMLHVVCFVGRVLDALRGREHKNAERRWVSVTSSRGVRVSFEGPVAILRGDRGEGLSAEMFVNDRLSVHIKLDVHLTPDC